MKNILVCLKVRRHYLRGHYNRFACRYLQSLIEWLCFSSFWLICSWSLCTLDQESLWHLYILGSDKLGFSKSISHLKRNGLGDRLFPCLVTFLSRWCSMRVDYLLPIGRIPGCVSSGWCSAFIVKLFPFVVFIRLYSCRCSSESQVHELVFDGRIHRVRFRSLRSNDS